MELKRTASSSIPTEILTAFYPNLYNLYVSIRKKNPIFDISLIWIPVHRERFGNKVLDETAKTESTLSTV